MPAHIAMPLKFWDEYFVTVVYIINRLPPTYGHDVSPLEKLFHVKPDYNFLKVFGCSCYSFLHPYNKHKLEFCSIHYIFLSYSSQHKGYRCLSPSGKIYISRDVKFDENSFPFQLLFPPSNEASPSPPYTSPSSIPPRISSYSQCDFNQNCNQSLPTAIADLPTNVDYLTNLDSTHKNTSASTIPPSASTPKTSATIVIPTANTIEAISISPIQKSSHLLSTNHGTATVTSTHPMITRSKIGIVKKKVLLTYSEPHSISEALSNPHWIKAMEDEYATLMKNNTWTLCTIPAHRKAVGCHWIFKIKKNADGSINRYKA